jgi:hypothetical protein
MKKRVASLALLSALTLTVPSSALAAYPLPGTEGVDDLFLTYVGWAPSDGGPTYANQQYWTTTDFDPVLTHLTSSGTADDFMFTDYLFLATAVKDSYGQLKTLTNANANAQQGTVVANEADWDIYLNELFASSKNINALYTSAYYNKKGTTVRPDVWIGLPYPHPSKYANDSLRIAAVKSWIDKFITRWNAGSYSNRLQFRGFYWLVESEYLNSTSYDDGYVMTEVNKYVHSKIVASSYLKTLWIPYQDANNWKLHKTFGFDLTIYQPHYLFNPASSLDKAAWEASYYGTGVEMELSHEVANPGTAQRSRFIEYLNKGATGGMYGSNSYPGYMKNAPIGWYPAGWVWERDAYGNPTSKTHPIHKLYGNRDSLYDNIYKFVKGTYVSGTAN